METGKRSQKYALLILDRKSFIILVVNEDNELSLVPASALIGILQNEDLQDLTTDFLEEQLDALLVDGVFKELPVIKSLIAVGKIGITYSNYLFLKKLLRFLKGASKVSKGERQHFLETLGDKKTRLKTGENLLLILDKLDNGDKPEMIANVFVAYVRGELSGYWFYKLSKIVDQVNLKDIPALQNFYGKKEVEPDPDSSIEDLEKLGLVSLKYPDELVFGSQQPSIMKNTTGEYFIRYALEN